MNITEYLTPGVLRALFAGAALVVCFLVLRRFLSTPKENPHLSTVTCTSCGWSGQVSKYKPRCPSCGQPIS